MGLGSDGRSDLGEFLDLTEPQFPCLSGGPNNTCSLAHHFHGERAGTCEALPVPDTVLSAPRQARQCSLVNEDLRAEGVSLEGHMAGRCVSPASESACQGAALRAVPGTRRALSKWQRKRLPVSAFTRARKRPVRDSQTPPAEEKAYALRRTRTRAGPSRPRQTPSAVVSGGEAPDCSPLLLRDFLSPPPFPFVCGLR